MSVSVSELDRVMIDCRNALLLLSRTVGRWRRSGVNLTQRNIEFIDTVSQAARGMRTAAAAMDEARGELYRRVKEIHGRNAKWPRRFAYQYTMDPRELSRYAQQLSALISHYDAGFKAVD